MNEPVNEFWPGGVAPAACSAPAPTLLLFWSWDKHTLPIHHLTGNSQISRQSHGGLGAVGDEPQMVSGFLTRPVSLPPTPEATHAAPIPRLHGQQEPGFSKPWDHSSAERKAGPGQRRPCPPLGSVGLPQGGPAARGGQELGANAEPTQPMGPFFPLSSLSWHPELASPHPPPTPILSPELQTPSTKSHRH